MLLAHFGACQAPGHASPQTRTMLKIPSPRVQDCYRRADECARRAEFADDADLRDYWEQQEACWIQIANYSEFSERVASFPKSGRRTPAAILREEESNIDALVDVSAASAPR